LPSGGLIFMSRGIILPKPWDFAGIWAFTLVNWSQDKTLNAKKPPSITRGKTRKTLDNCIEINPAILDGI
jgi:hypothetical protein